MPRPWTLNPSRSPNNAVRARPGKVDFRFSSRDVLRTLIRDLLIRHGDSTVPGRALASACADSCPVAPFVAPGRNSRVLIYDPFTPLAVGVRRYPDTSVSR